MKFLIDECLSPDLTKRAHEKGHGESSHVVWLGFAGLKDWELTRIISQRTRRRRAERNQPLTIEESDRAVRLVRIQSLAEETFGDTDKANRWLRKGLAQLGGETPLTVAQTEAGVRVIKTVLGKIACGAAD
jgi:putative toxin-antitoxin system antitoxin component (TIGR02293 family)